MNLFIIRIPMLRVIKKRENSCHWLHTGCVIYKDGRSDDRKKNMKHKYVLLCTDTYHCYLYFFFILFFSIYINNCLRRKVEDLYQISFY